MEYQLSKKLNNIENELDNLKTLILSISTYKIRKPVSFRGMAKTKLNEQELDEAIEEAQGSMFKGM